MKSDGMKKVVSRADSPFVDQILRREAVNPSSVISSIDNSYRDFIFKLTKDLKRGVIPLKDEEYQAHIIPPDKIYIVGWEGIIEIKRIYGSRRTLYLVKPLHSPTVRIYAEFDYNSHFCGYTMMPAYGFHFVDSGTSVNGIQMATICTGELNPPTPKSVLEIRTTSLSIANLLAGINLNSIGNTHMPKTNPINEVIARQRRTHDNWVALCEKKLIDSKLVTF